MEGEGEGEGGGRGEQQEEGVSSTCVAVVYMWLSLGRVVVRVESMLWGASSSSRWRVVEVKGLNSPPPLLLLENERAVASLSFSIHASDANFSNLRARGRRYTHVGYVRGVCRYDIVVCLFACFSRFFLVISSFSGAFLHNCVPLVPEILQEFISQDPCSSSTSNILESSPPPKV